MNSLLFISNSMSSKNSLTRFTRLGSPTVMIVSEICFGSKLKWYTLPSSFRIKSVSDIFGIAGIMLLLFEQDYRTLFLLLLRAQQQRNLLQRVHLYQL